MLWKRRGPRADFQGTPACGHQEDEGGDCKGALWLGGELRRWGPGRHGEDVYKDGSVTWSDADAEDQY